MIAIFLPSRYAFVSAETFLSFSGMFCTGSAIGFGVSVVVATGFFSFLHEKSESAEIEAKVKNEFFIIRLMRQFLIIGLF